MTLLLANPAATPADLVAALAEAGLASTIAALPRGMATPLGDAGLGLSGGQARRLAVARARLHDRPLWLLDEPTDGLDAATAADVLDRLARAATGRTLVIATHLQAAPMSLEQLKKVIALHQHIVELKEGQPPLQPLLVTLCRQHAVNGKVNADISDKLNIVQRQKPIGIVGHEGFSF